MRKLEFQGNQARLTGLTPQSIGAAQLENGKVPASQLPPAIYPYNHIHFWGSGLIIAGGLFQIVVSANYQFNRLANQSPGALGDSVEFYPVLAAGNYRLTLLSDQGPNRGIIELFHNNNSIGSINAFNSTVLNNINSSFNLRVTTPGMQTLTTRVTSKASASTGFLFRCVAVLIDSVP